MLENTTERDNLAASLVDAVANDLIDGVEGRGNVGEGTVFVGLLHAYLSYIKAVIDLEIVADVSHVEGIETGLCLAQRRLHLAGL